MVVALPLLMGGSGALPVGKLTSAFASGVDGALQDVGVGI